MDEKGLDEDGNPIVDQEDEAEEEEAANGDVNETENQQETPDEKAPEKVKKERKKKEKSKEKGPKVYKRKEGQEMKYQPKNGQAAAEGQPEYQDDAIVAVEEGGANNK